MDHNALVDMLAAHPLLAGLTRAQLETLARCARVVDLPLNGFLAREGDPAIGLLLLTRGRLALESHMPGRGGVAVETFRAGEVLGWSTLFPPFVWHLDVRAVEPATMVQLESGPLQDIFQADHALGHLVTHRLLGEVSRRLARARLQQLDVYKAEHR